MIKTTWLRQLWSASLALMCACTLLSGVRPAAADDQFEEGQACVILVPGYDVDEFNDRWDTSTQAAVPEANLYLLEVPDDEDLFAFVEAIGGDEAVDIAEVNWYQETPEGVRQVVIAAIGGTWADFQDQSMTDRIGLDLAHEMSRGAGITVAVLDTGVDPDHEVFEGRLADQGYDCIDFDDEPWETANGDNEDGDGLIDEGYGHGTMVAGLIALLAPEAEILPIRVLNDEGQGTIFAVALGIVKAVAGGADVINASFGAPARSGVIANILQIAEEDGVVMFAGAGNRDMELDPYYPAIDERAIMVTALDSCDVKADFADYHPLVVVSAPGDGIRSAYPGDEWGLGSGCSFATPLVAGEAALILSLDPTASVGDLKASVTAGVDPIYHLQGNLPYAGKLGSGRIFVPTALSGSYADVVEDAAVRSLLVAGPNPFNGEVRLSLGHSRSVFSAGAVEILDATGRLVRTLPLDGTAATTWTGTDRHGRRLPAGAYFARLPGEGPGRSIPLILIR